MVRRTTKDHGCPRLWKRRPPCGTFGLVPDSVIAGRAGGLQGFDRWRTAIEPSAQGIRGRPGVRSAGEVADVRREVAGDEVGEGDLVDDVLYGGVGGEPDVPEVDGG